MLMAVPTPGRTASAAILATVLQAVFTIAGGVPTGQVIGGSGTTTTRLQGGTTTSRTHGGTVTHDV